MIKNIIFDLGNVIINYDQKAIIERFAENEEEKEYIYNEIFNAPEWEMQDLGNVTNIEAAEIINKRNNLKYEKLTQVFLMEWYKEQKINKDIIEIAKKLKEKGYNIYVLSNMANFTYEYFKKEEFFSLCSGIVISAYEHLKKPDKKIYELILERYELKAEECLFIDDTEKNYKTANEIGIQGRNIIPNSSEDVIKLLKEYKIEL